MTLHTLVVLGLVLAPPRQQDPDQHDNIGQQDNIAPPSSVGQERRAGRQDQRTPPSQRTLGEMSTDRPDITDSTDIVGRGRWQVESGVSLELDRQDGVSAHSLAAPLAMFRLGLRQRLELRVSADGVLSDAVTVSVDAGRRTRVTGRSDIEVGAKWRLFDQPRRGFLVALEPVLSLPTGSDGFTSGGYDPTLKLIVDRDLPQGFGLSGNVVVSSWTDSDHRFIQHAISLSLAHGLASGWNGFAELYRASALVRDGTRAWIADIGATHALGKRAQVDISGGRGLTDAAPDWFIGTGFAVRGFLVR